MKPICLENKKLRLEFDSRTGALTSLTALETGWKILDRPQLGLSFRLLVPLRSQSDWHAPTPRNHNIRGEQQLLHSCELTSENSGVTFKWANVVSESGTVFPIEVVMQIALTEEQAVFAVVINNRSTYTVETVYCPYLGDLQHPPSVEWFRTFLYVYASAQEWSLWPSYQNLRGYFGVDFPTQFGQISHALGAPCAPFILLRGENQGLYAGVAAASSELVAWHTELRPGYSSSIDARVPSMSEIAGKDVHTRFAAVHIPYIQPGEKRELTPIALQPYQGGWQHGVDIYKTWRSTWMKLPKVPAWATDPHAWQQVHINSPEDELRIRFSDLPRIGAECAAHGVKAIQLVGWNDGGQDQGNPSHDPDPRLGTFEELRQAIRRINEMGVKVILFAKFTWSDRATPRFHSDLHRLAIKDPYGDFHVYAGYQYQTATQLLDLNTKRLIPMCFLSEEYLRLCDEEFKKTVDLGADGILFDECLHHSPALLCFDPNHGHRYGAPVYANDRKLIWNFDRIAQNPDFLFAGEACYDWEMEAYQLSYHRSESKAHIPLSRYMLPEAQFMTAVTGFNDRNMVNQCLLYRYIISYEPYNFKGSLNDFPETVAYGRQMDHLRTILREFFWDGEFRDTVGASVTLNGQHHHPYSVFHSRTSHKSALVVGNYDDWKTITLQATLDNGESLSKYRLIDDEEWKPVASGIILPPQSAAVVLPE
jgi:hypothetical protein